MICLLARWSYKKLTDTWTSAQSPELTYSMLHTHTGAVLQSDSSLQIDQHTQRAASEQTDVTV